MYPLEVAFESSFKWASSFLLCTKQLSQSLLGVAGVDVPTSQFDQAVPDSQLGFGGYKMVVMPTGNAVMHPRLQSHTSYLEVKNQTANKRCPFPLKCPSFDPHPVLFLIGAIGRHTTTALYRTN